MQGDAGPDRDLVADDDGGQKLIRGRIDELRDGQRGRSDDGAGMALGQPVPVVEVQHVREHTIRERGAGGAEAPRVQQRRGFIACVHGLRVLYGQRRCRGGASAGAYGRHVAQQQPGPIPHAFGNICKSQLGDEGGQLAVAAGRAGHHLTVLDVRRRLP